MTKFNLAKLRKVLGAPQKHVKRHNKKLEKIVRGKKRESRKDSLDSLINRFRFLNEKLYNCSSKEAATLFKEDPGAFGIYHEGYKQQLSQWPQDPLIWQTSGSNKRLKIADLGCGDARLSHMLPNEHKVYSFDLVSVNERVTACDMAHTPLKTNEVDFAVFCLSLMGTNCSEFLYEANRILKSE
ncbi:unnamed protein product [Trichobilharzia regenti]|nr:unnamed protein product [Trichobilharzia regenti]